MNYNVLSTHRFQKKLKQLVKKFPSLKKEYADLIVEMTLLQRMTY